MGRLYWKFFLFFFLAQLTSVLGVGMAFSLQREREEIQRERIVAIQPADKALSTQNQRPPSRHRRFPVIPILIGMLASLIFAALLAWYFSKPIKQLRLAFASAANGNLDVRVGKAIGSRRDELADLGNDFDVMATQLGVLMQSQTRLLHQVSHELRSPLARLQMAVGLARQQPDKLESSLMRIDRESERMDSLVGELLALSRLESGVMKLEKEAIDVNDLLLAVVEDAQFEGVTKQIHVDYQPVLGISVLGQPDLLHRAIDNVVRNALKYSQPEAKVSIAASVTNTNVLITVLDKGLGVKEAELDLIFQPFFRGSNTSQAEGHGVGLAVAKQIVEAHGGNIKASNQPTGGLCVVISLNLMA